MTKPILSRTVREVAAPHLARRIKQAKWEGRWHGFLVGWIAGSVVVGLLMEGVRNG